jgi:hypothetical protein
MTSSRTNQSRNRKLLSKPEPKGNAPLLIYFRRISGSDFSVSSAATAFGVRWFSKTKAGLKMKGTGPSLPPQ